ncbi:MAG: osmotically inducible protein OsmC [Alphaproteobacteria bacterium]|jgi:osmotically inducible protein OsmC
MKAIYSASATTTGGREGQSASSDGNLNITLSTPKELGGAGGDGTNPEQLFAAGYSACFIGAMKHVAGAQKIKLPEDLSITCVVGIGENTEGPGFMISADMTVNFPGMDNDIATKLVEDSHQVCPYSNATRGNIEVNLTVIV